MIGNSRVGFILWTSALIIMSLMAFVKFGYMLVIVSMLLMIWASLARASEVHADTSHLPCLFQALCTCSKPIGDLGVVTCNHVPILRVPQSINSSKIFTLQLQGNGIRFLEPQFFQLTGLYRLEINQNPLETIHDEAFYGLDNSLWELVLKEDQLTTVPSRSLRYLQKLQHLDLSGNEITDISSDNWRGFGVQLHTLILAKNSIRNLPLDAFAGLPILETLDLHGNHINMIDSGVFRDGMNRLANLLLQDNQLTAIPYEELSPLRQLRVLDLSNNVIKSVQPQRDIKGYKMSLDTLKLDYNALTVLLPHSFINFDVLNTTSLDGNPIYSVREDAFRNAKIRSLSLRDCGIVELSPAAFTGLETTLQYLDLSQNNLTLFTTVTLQKLDALRHLNLKENKVNSLNSPFDYQYATSYNNFQYKLNYLDMSGASSVEMTLQDVRRMRSLHYLSVGKLIGQSLQPEDFIEFGVELEELKIIGSTVTRIDANAFQHVRTIKSLDLSDNNLDYIDPLAFAELHFLTTLKMANGLDESVRILPFESLKALILLQNLDLSNNKLKNVPDTSFHFLYKLEKLNLQDNAIDYFSKGTLQGDIHKQLKSICLSHNLLRQIAQHTFVQLRELKEVLIEDNLIDVVQRRAFISLDNLNTIKLRGNKIYAISDEAFQNLPALQELDISFNQLESFKFSMFDQVGTATALKLNASYNRIITLTDSNAPSYFTSHLYQAPASQGRTVSVNIRVLDFSHNNITYIASNYFRHTTLTLSKLHLSHNRLRNITRDVFGQMVQLQYLDISHNFIIDMEYDCFKRSTQLQIIDLSHNELIDLPVEVFRDMKLLTTVNLSNNRIRNLVDNFISSPYLERLDLSNNYLSAIPTNCLTEAAAWNIVELDLSGNNIPSVSKTDFVLRFRDGRPGSYYHHNEEPEYNDDYNNMYHSARRDDTRVYHEKKPYPQHILYESLALLDLSNNHLVRIDSGAFSAVPKLRWLDISNNPSITFERDGQIFRGLERSLTHLGLRNISMKSVPPLNLPHLKSLDLAYNNLPSLSIESTQNLTRLRSLDISYNDLSTVPVATHSLLKLRWLSLSGNPITALMNTSLLGLTPGLEYLDITQLRLRFIESGAFSRMYGLRTLKLNVYAQNRNTNIPRMLTYNVGLRNLLIEVNDDRVNLGNEMYGTLPPKLNNISITGPALEYLSENILIGVYSRVLRLTIYNTSITEIEPSTFWSPGRLQNLTLDLRWNRLTGVPNPSRKPWPGVPYNIFLHDILLSSNPLYCDCGIGWVEAWDRKRRQYLCKDPTTCIATRDDVRFSNCNNYENRSLNDVFINDLDCYFGSGFSISPKVYMIAGFVIATMFYI